MVKYTGAFPDDVSNAIGKQICQLAVYSNRLTQITDIPSKKICDILVEPHRREFAKDAAQTFGDNMTSDLFETGVWFKPPTLDLDLPEQVRPSDPKQNMCIHLNWSHDRPFARPPTDAHGFYDDAQPELIARLNTMAHEIIRNGVQYDFVYEVWWWVNSFCVAGDRVHARWLLPGIVPMLTRAGFGEMADKLQRTRHPVSRKPVPLEMVPALQLANELISAGLMLGTPEKNIIKDGMAWVEIDNPVNYDHPLLKETPCVPIVTLSDQR